MFGKRTAGVATLVAATLAVAYGQTDWPVYGHDPGGMRFSPLTQISTKNVTSLQRVWTYHTKVGEVSAPPHGDMGQPCQNCHGDARRGSPVYEATPLIIGDVMYLPTVYSRIVALQPETGRALWETKTRHPLYSRGLAYWPGDTRTAPRLLLGTNDGWLLALDAKTGSLVKDFADNGELDLRAGVSEVPGMYAVTSPVVVYRDLVITGSRVPESPGRGPMGDVRAWNVRTGKLAWRFHSVPQPGEPNHEAWPGDTWKNRTGVNVWTIFTVDAQRGIVYLPFGQAAYDYYGGDRQGSNLYGDSLVALEAASGKMLWYRQFVHHDLWDYDLPAAPALIDVTRGGQTIPALVQVTKQGLVFFLNRLTGEAIYPIEERPVPKSTVPGEESWPTQAFPVKPPPLSRQTFSRDEIATVTPEHQKYCQDLLDKIKVLPQQPFTPLGTELSVYFPGSIGGANWGGVSYDPSLGYVFVNTFNVGAIGQLIKQPDGSKNAYQRNSPLGPVGRFWDPEKLWPCHQPPWGELTAINANTGDIAWKVTLGVVDELEARGVHNTGALNLGGSIATAGGLLFIGATSDSRFRAFDTRTGKELWVTRIDATSHATPVTYLGKDGKQYVVIATGGTGYFNKSTADSVIAFALP